MSTRKYFTYSSIKSMIKKRNLINIANNTVATNNDDQSISVYYHGSKIVTLYGNGDIWISSNGYQTVTTKERLNWFLNPVNFSVYSVNFNWILYDHSIKREYKDLCFEGGIYIYSSLRVIKHV